MTVEATPHLRCQERFLALSFLTPIYIYYIRKRNNCAYFYTKIPRHLAGGFKPSLLSPYL